MIIIPTSLLLLFYLKNKLKLKNFDIIVCLFFLIIIVKLCHGKYLINNLNSFSPPFNKQFKKIEYNLNNNDWTSDMIIPLEKYNPKDCTNDNTCIIPPDKYNLFPQFQLYLYSPSISFVAALV